jgi:hypothetical protein
MMVIHFIGIMPYHTIPYHNTIHVMHFSFGIEFDSFNGCLDDGASGGRSKKSKRSSSSSGSGSDSPDMNNQLLGLLASEHTFQSLTITTLAPFISFHSLLVDRYQ